MRPVFEWKLRSRALHLGKKTVVMGVVNVTPDSFSDGGLYFDRDRAVARALQLFDDGAEIVDIGGESTRPGSSVNGPAEPAPKATGSSKSGAAKQAAVEKRFAAASSIGMIASLEKSPSQKPAAEKVVTVKEELDRVIPVITAVHSKRPDALISVDTYRASVARAAVEAGAEIVNDVSGFRWDDSMCKTLAELKCGAVLMHMRGRPDEWRTLPPPGDIVVLVKRELRDWADTALLAGVKREHIALDPGFGFGKNYEQNYPMLKRFDDFHQLHYPLVVGLSRKSFIGRALARDGKDAPVADRQFGTLAAETAAALMGAHVIRTHDVRACVDAMRVADLVVS